ncbi:MAG: ADOP family duplicated permease [Gemmatimonadaceae bacterium]
MTPLQLLHAIGTRLQALVGRGAQERDMDEEMRFHLDMEARRLVREEGLDDAEARRRAARDFGGVERYKEEVRDERGTRVLEDLGQDVRYAARSLRRRPAFTAVAAITLALGIGATTALFGVVKAVLLTPLPYAQPERVAVLWSAWTGFDQTWLSYDEFEAWDSEIPGIENAALWSTQAINLTEGGEPERLVAGTVTHDMFSVLGVSPMIGRGFTKEEDAPNGPRAIVLGHGLWQRRFGGDPAIVGKSILVSGQATPVVGIMPPGFRLPLDFAGGAPTEAWMPLATDAEQNGAVPGPTFQRGGGNHGFLAVARLKPGVTAQQVNAQLTDKVARLVRDGFIPEPMRFRAYAVPVQDQVTGRVRPALLVTFGAVGLVLLIACANVAGLMLVRGEGRRRELAVRVALGAGTRRIARQLLTESLVLAGIGAASGVALAAAAVWAIRRSAPVDLPRFTETRLDPAVLAFALVAAALAAVLTGLLPALQATRVAPAGELKEGGRGATAGAARLRWRQALVVTEVALAVVLAAGAGLMVRSVASLLAIDAGLDPSHVLTMRLSTPSTYYADSIKVTAFHEELRRKVKSLPGVREVGAVRILPLASDAGDWGLRVEGYTPAEGQYTPGDWNVVGPGYFEAMGLKLLQGRTLDERDGMSAPLAMVVNREFTKLYLAGRNPLGTRVWIGGSPDSLPYTIVGVVENVHHNGLTSEVKAQFYATVAQYAKAPGSTSRGMTLVVKTAGDPAALVRPIRQAIRSMDPRLPVSEVRTMEEVVAGSIAAPRFAMQLLALFGVLALVLSAIGIYGIVSQVVAARQHEFGIRLALGATPGGLVRLSLGAGVRQAVVGLAFGVAAALLFTRLLRGLLHGVAPTDPVTFAAVVVVTGLVAVLASAGPARRAGRADPAAVLHDA